MPSTIMQGSTGEDVRRLQRAFVRARVLDLSHLDGTFGPATTAVVRAHQAQHSLVVDGVVGPKTWGSLPEYLEASPLLRLGTTGPVVAMLQTALHAVSGTGRYDGPVDGLFGGGTIEAITEYQQLLGLTVDGVVGQQTWMVHDHEGRSLEERAGLVFS